MRGKWRKRYQSEWGESFSCLPGSSDWVPVPFPSSWGQSSQSGLSFMLDWTFCCHRMGSSQNQNPVTHKLLRRAGHVPYRAGLFQSFFFLAKYSLPKQCHPEYHNVRREIAVIILFSLEHPFTYLELCCLQRSFPLYEMIKAACTTKETCKLGTVQSLQLALLCLVAFLSLGIQPEGM